MLPPGLVQTGHKPALPRWGFSHLGRQTECERIPSPAKYFWITSSRRHLCASPSSTLTLTHSPQSKFRLLRCPSYFLGRYARRSDSKERPLNRYHQRNISSLFCVRCVDQLRKSSSAPFLTALFAREVGIFDRTRRRTARATCVSRRRRAGALRTRCWPDSFRTDRRAPSS